MKTFTAKGVTVPSLGLGTWRLNGAACEEVVEHALEIGYRHIDTAQGYENEAEVGAAIARSGLRREEVWLTSKVWVDDAPLMDLVSVAQKSLERLRVDRLDLLLAHWPPPRSPIERAINALSEVRNRGLTCHTGLSNFTPSQVETALSIDPFLLCNQVEMHPYLRQDRLLAQAKTRDILPVAYCPLAQGRAARDPVLCAIGARRGWTAAQVCLRWLLQRGVVVIPKATNRAHLLANVAVFDLEQLSDEEMCEIDALHSEDRSINPEFAPNWDN
ncbi:aldo/keto reductase [Legionella clemsonensis]|uniref:2,5-diketo-D-gluconic acid reductase B n=1 Tax=Legionella clemsonensis TaxID=1867846 RepID=A0A222NYV8_9GAMM|nr:aldo/keto reductase [Legionella clemsonensis]ASQ44774.1 2,5-diketo-D-gluconic acid reductase B [Legionella clemsonensis]